MERMTSCFTKARRSQALRGTSFLAMAAVALALIAAPDPASAANRASRHAEHTAEATAPREGGPPIMAIVSLKSQHVTIFDADGWIMRAPVSSGQKGRETPAGVFSVIQKDADHHSNLYDDASMPHMERITWSGIALHGGPLPGHAASHGCVRMPYGFAAQLFGKTKLGMRVVIAPHDVSPVDIVHPVLFQPKPDAGAHAALLATEATDAAKKADAARLAAVTAQREAAAATAQIRKLNALKARADAQLAAADRAVGAAKSDDAKAKAEDARQKAAARVAELQAQLEAASAEAQPKLDAVQPARDAAAVAGSARAAAAKAARDEARALEPVSVFISRKTQRLYVRRGFEQVLDVPVTIQNSDQPIGTHVFTAMAKTDTGLRWSVVTINDGADAKSALDRITIPQDVLDRIGPTAAVRSSLIVSDEAVSPETGKGTEFVAVLSNEPQGGLAMRKRPSSEVRYARQRDAYPEFGYAPQRDRGYYGGSSYRSPFSSW
jgi:lipoprotein-anchoring transpeptidase ErfK/SrfK